MPKQVNTKQKIIEAAIDLIAKYGYRGASVRKIAAEVGIRESAIYNHFKNKEEILKQIIAEIFVTPFEFKNVEEKAKRGKSFLREFVVAYKLITFDKKKEKLFRVLVIELFQNAALRESFLQEFHQKDIQQISQAFFIMMQNGLIRSGDPMFMAQEFLAPLFYIRLQVSLLRIDGKPTTPVSTQFEKHVDFFWESVSLQ
ncbi:TetR/AcrR family transcriptional regulator [Hydrogenimonas sp.]|jgi:AcrR family transcriptional regulator|uniref:TetR/AcrR family transcriptional regulator n=1 Tax=Hydrogenimonas sp. TaxID=2231112 RepID=UPI00262F25BE|nr:TetR/AcrR family transcriptional regulator [Hydrogenimonas sp.]